MVLSRFLALESKCSKYFYFLGLNNLIRIQPKHSLIFFDEKKTFFNLNLNKGSRLFSSPRRLQTRN